MASGSHEQTETETERDDLTYKTEILTERYSTRNRQGRGQRERGEGEIHKRDNEIIIGVAE